MEYISIDDALERSRLSINSVRTFPLEARTNILTDDQETDYQELYDQYDADDDEDEKDLDEEQ